jgi:hypothetical protein
MEADTVIDAPLELLVSCRSRLGEEDVLFDSIDQLGFIERISPSRAVLYTWRSPSDAAKVVDAWTCSIGNEATISDVTGAEVLTRTERNLAFGLLGFEVPTGAKPRSYVKELRAKFASLRRDELLRLPPKFREALALD